MTFGTKFSRSPFFLFFLVAVCYASLGGETQLVVAQDDKSGEAVDADASSESSSKKIDLKLPSFLEQPELQLGDGSSESDDKLADGEAPKTPEQEAAEKEYRERLAKRIAAFREKKAELAGEMGELRAIMIKYVNEEFRGPKALRDRREKRVKVRRLLDETYQRALDVIRIGFDQDAAQFILTMVQHRLDYSMYSESTAEGAARLIDGGANYLFLFLCGARSAAVSGKFEVARRLYSTIPGDELEETDRILKFSLERIKEEYQKEIKVRQQDAERDDLPRVKLETTQGEIILELYLREAPSTVAHFLGLVREGFYDGLEFYQVVEDLLALTGDPTGLGDGGCGKYLADEHFNDNTRGGLRGSLVMAKKPLDKPGNFYPNSASSQFAILFLPHVNITNNQTVFGRVIEGMETVCRLKRVDPNEEKKNKKLQLPPDRIISATILRAPESLPEPQYFDVHAAIQAELEAMRSGQSDRKPVQKTDAAADDHPQEDGHDHGQEKTAE